MAGIIFLVFNIFVFLLGLCIGSFLNCVIYRLEKKEKITGRSYCPNCKKQLKWNDLAPVFSFLFLRGKCRYCKKAISPQYPLVELATGILFVLIFWSLGFDWALGIGLPVQVGILDLIKTCFLFYISSALIVIFVYDLKHYLIPDKVLFPAIIIAILYRLIEVLDFGHLNLFLIFDLGFRIFAPLLSYFWATLIASGFFLFIFLISRGRWMGFGDVKLTVLMGLVLGVPDILTALFLAFFFGATISIVLIIFGKKGLKSEVPFGPFLIAGTFMAMLWGEEIIQWYWHLFLI